MDAAKGQEEESQELKPKNKGGRPRKPKRKPRKRLPPKIKNPLQHKRRSEASKRSWATQLAKNPNLIEERRAQCKKWNAERKGAPRLGVPDGWTKIKAGIQRVLDGCRADLIIDRMREKGMIDPVSLSDFERVTVIVDGKPTEVLVPASDDAKAQAALREAMIGAISPLTNANVRPTYIRTVLEWTKAKPAQKTDLNITKSEDWLEAALKDNSEPYDADCNDEGATEAP